MDIGEITQEEAVNAAIIPIREFMYPHTQTKDVGLFLECVLFPSFDSINCSSGISVNIVTESFPIATALKPDLVLMDITMPEMDGIQALKKIKESDPGAMVIMCTFH